MASNGFGTLYVGTTGLKAASNSINTTANNLANVNTKGYVRQQALQSDMVYNDVPQPSSIKKMQYGLGAQLAEVVHTRDIFLDKYYRTENGRQNFYSTLSNTIDEVQTIFQEMEGQQFEYAMTDFRTSFEELAKDPSDSVNQNLVIQKATLFLSRATAVEESLQDYQSNLNTQVTDMINRINEIGAEICDLNRSISRIEAGKVETAYDMRDQRDNLIDELSKYVKCEATEIYDGTVTIKIEGTEFVEGVRYSELEGTRNEISGYIEPSWKKLSNLGNGDIKYLYDLSNGFDTERNTDIGELKSLLLCRGDMQANLLSGMYNQLSELGISGISDFTDLSILMTVESQLDTLVSTMAKSINDIFSPLTDTVTSTADLTNLGINAAITANHANVGQTTYTLTYTDADGRTQTLQSETGFRFWDSEKGSLGSDGKGPGRELFSRAFVGRYTELTITNADGSTGSIYLYNEEDYSDTATVYTLQNLTVNEEISRDGTLLPFKKKNGDVDYEMGEALAAVWTTGQDALNGMTFTGYYNAIINNVADLGNVYNGLSETLDTTVTALDNQRTEVIGVSSDEELSNLIRYQNAYNASSRFINVVNEMIELLVTQL